MIISNSFKRILSNERSLTERLIPKSNIFKIENQIKKLVRTKILISKNRKEIKNLLIKMNYKIYTL